MGRRISERYKRYRAYRGFGDCVYLMEWGDGCVKVGYSRVPDSRLECLHRNSVRACGKPPGRLQVFKTQGNPFAAEHACILALRNVAKRRYGVFEYFDGIGFDAAAAVVALAVKEAA